jgi:hypothetical protein
MLRPKLGNSKSDNRTIQVSAFGGTRLHHGSYAVRALHASARLHGEFFKGKKAGIDAGLFTESLAQWMKAQRAASTRLGRELQNDLEKLDVSSQNLFQNVR